MVDKCTMTIVANKDILLLNSNYAPMSVITWRRAFSLWLKDKVEILEEYDDFDIKSISFTMKCPAVVRLLNHVGYKRLPKFSRINIYRRDAFKCLYCGRKPGIKDLTFDHVIPKSRGGKTTWQNIATACWPCNVHKGQKLPDEARMKLRKIPAIPSEHAFLRFTFDLPKTPDAWRSYLYWTTEIEE